nr:hypothetical protein [uncultured Tateyamaria sp.]
MLRFTGAGTEEPHPFSFSKICSDGLLRVTVKDLGDFTSDLKTVTLLGREVAIQRPFGRFRRSGPTAEIWVEGGIGVTPFLAWADALECDAPRVDLIVHH